MRVRAKIWPGHRMRPISYEVDGEKCFRVFCPVIPKGARSILCMSFDSWREPLDVGPEALELAVEPFERLGEFLGRFDEKEPHLIG